jgi:hypothetical protein
MEISNPKHFFHICLGDRLASAAEGAESHERHKIGIPPDKLSIRLFLHRG